MVLNVAIIGGASGKGQEYMQALLERPDDVSITSIVINRTLPQKVQEWAEKYNWKVIPNGDIQQLENVDIAIVSLPHDQHDFVVRALVKQGIYIIKEKPLAMNLELAKDYQKIMGEEGRWPIYTTVQRSTHKLFRQAKTDLEKIGKVLRFHYEYTFCLPNQTSGWRSDPEKSGGGVVLDMGYHILDVVGDFFGYPQAIKSRFSYKFPDFEKSKLEDAAEIMLTYDGFEGQVLLDRHADAKVEEFVIEGEKGTLTLTPGSYTLDLADVRVEQKAAFSKLAIIQQMFDVCLFPDEDLLKRQFVKNMDTMRMIEAIYQQKR